ncbi:hypothetical protein ColLi_08264 [Colletotrichum liriopes]|uniref:Uncharacterized protein n=1 Tax=Colletotrichum liriopes TaxID=708192 RepID=A0AA37GQL8_9PEZI|nr:hypothetical protein ColLi_08264 [Colletotrichum liriopes]
MHLHLELSHDVCLSTTTPKPRQPPYLLKHAPIDFPNIRDAIRTGMLARVWSNPTLTPSRLSRPSATSARPKPTSALVPQPHIQEKAARRRKCRRLERRCDCSPAAAAPHRRRLAGRVSRLPADLCRYKDDEIQELGCAYMANIQDSGGPSLLETPLGDDGTDIMDHFHRKE